jgi:hypothetical protein
LKNDVGKDLEVEVVSGDVLDGRHCRFSVLGSQFSERRGDVEGTGYCKAAVSS